MRYDICVAGDLDLTTIADFGEADVAVDGDVTVLSVDVDQAGLHGLLERVRVCGVELIEVRRARSSQP